MALTAPVRAVPSLLDRPAQLLFGLRLWALGVLLLALAVLKNGIWYTPNLHAYVEIGRYFPERPPPGPGDYLLSSPLGAAIASVLHLDSSLAFVILHLAVVLASAVGLVFLISRRFGDVGARLVLVALFCSPLSNLLLTWLGQADAFTFGSATALVVLRSPPALFVAAAVLGLNHFEQGVFIVLATCLLRLNADRRQAVAAVGAIAAGLLVGKAVLETYHHLYDITMVSRWDVAGMVGIESLLESFSKNLPVWLFSVFNSLWLFLVVVHLRHLRTLVLPLGLLVAFVAPAALSLDQTRVYALTTWPVVLWVVLWAARNEDEGLLRSLTLMTLILGVLLPRVIVWEGRTYTSSLRLLVGWLTG